MSETISVTNDPRFKQGRKFMNEKKYEDAINIFASLLQTCNETYGELSMESCYVYYEYGNALLTNEEENSSNEVLGSVANPSGGGNAAEEDEDVADDESQDDNEGEEGDGEEGGANGNDAESDLQVAWEVLDVSRVILAGKKDKTKEEHLLLSDVHVRLGDLMRFNGKIQDSIDEYEKALEIRSTHCESHDRLLSDVHFSLAVAYIYNASEPEVSDPLAEKEEALTHYKLSKESIAKWLEKFSKEEGKKGEAADHKELSDTLQETIDALSAEIKEEKGGCAAAYSSAKPVTTIGFGQPSSSSSSTAAVSVFSSSAAAATDVNTLQIKKKKRPISEVDQA